MQKAFAAVLFLAVFATAVYADTATLSVSSNPSGGTVTNINTGYQYCSPTPCSAQVTVPPNSINIRVTRDGYYDWTYLVYVYANQTTSVSAQLLSMDPCAGVTCNSPPSSACEDSNLRTYSSPGNC